MRVPSPSRRLRRAVSCSLLTGVLTLAAACGGDDGESESESQDPTTPSASETASSTPTATESPSASTSSATTTAQDCADGSYCDSFDDPSSGWKEQSTAGYSTSYDESHGGTFRIATRENASHAASAPTSVSDLSTDYAITVDVDTRIAPGMPDTGAYGITCWNHATQDEVGDSAFLLYVDAKTAIIGLWDEISAEYVPVAEKPLDGELKVGDVNHLTATCARAQQSGAPTARLALSVNGTEVVTGTYARSAEHPWDVGDGVGLVTAGAGADVLFDDFEVTGG